MTLILRCCLHCIAPFAFLRSSAPPGSAFPTPVYMFTVALTAFVFVCRPPSYVLLTVGGLQVTALPHQVLVLEQQALPQQGPPQTQKSCTELQPDVKEQQNPFFMQSTAIQAPPPPPPAVNPPAPQYQQSSAGERPTTTSTVGHSDLSQALLQNTAALEGNLSASQCGADIDTSDEADELRHLATDATGTAHHHEAPAGPSVPRSGAIALIGWVVKLCCRMHVLV